MTSSTGHGRPRGGPWIFAFVRIWCYLRHARLMLHYRRRMGAFPDPVVPRSVEEKFLWRKIFDHNPLFVVVSDKLRAKEYVRDVMPGLAQAKLLWFGNDVAAIPDALLQGNVAIKANNGSRQNRLVREGDVSRGELAREVASWLRSRYGQGKGEWAYRYVAQCIFIEELLLENGAPARTEYKFHVGGGRTSYVYLRAAGERGEREIVLSRDGEAFAIDAAEGMPLTDFRPSANFARLREVAETLARPFDFVRCDLYDIDGTIYFSELTIYPSSGYGTIKNRRLREQRNRDWDLRRSWFLTAQQSGWRRLYVEALRARISAEERALPD
jgi:hypothetical protein